MQLHQRIILGITFLFFNFSVFSQLTTFEKFYGYDSTNDLLNNIQPTNDGGYVAVGESQSPTKLSEFQIVKFDENGTIEFSKSIGTSNIETANAVAILENGYAIGGSTFADGENNRDCYLVTVDFQGNLLEETIFGGEGDDVIFDLISLENGDIAVAASYEDVIVTGADFNIRRYTSSLDLLAEIEYDNQLADYPSFIIEDKNSGNILIGGTSNARGFLMNCSPQLDMVLWTKAGSANGYGTYRTGLDFDDDFYIVGIKPSNQHESYLGFVDKNSGEYGELIPLPEPSAGGYQPQKIIKKGNSIYLFNARSNTSIGRALLKYDFVNESFSEEYVLEKSAKDMAVQEDERVAIIHKSSSDVYKVDVVQEFNENITENWSTNVGDLQPFSYQAGKEVIEAEVDFMYIAGEITRGSNYKRNVILNKVNANGVVVWETEIVIGPENRFGGITKTTDNGCVVAVLYSTTGTLLNKLAFQKYNSDGTIDWNKEIDISDFSFISNGNVESDDDGFIYFSGTVNGQAFLSAILFLKLNEASDLIEQKLISNPNTFLTADKMIISSNEEILITGHQDQIDGRNPLAIKLDSDGEILWQTTTGIDSDLNIFRGITEEDEGNFLIINGRQTISKIDNEGVILDTFYLSSNEPGTDLMDITMAQDSTFYILDDFFKFTPVQAIYNPIRSNYVVVRHLDKDFNPLDTVALGYGRNATANQIFAHSQGGIVIYGEAIKDNNRHGYLIGVNAEGITSTIDIQPQGNLTVFPTINNGQFTIDLNSPHTGNLSLYLFDATGKIIYSAFERKDNLEWKQELNLPKLVSGIYFIHLKIGEFGWTKQIIKQ